MRFLALAVFSILLASGAHADTMANCAASWKTMGTADKAKTSYKAYSSMCLQSDYRVKPPPGATAQCKDGSYSMSKTASGRCSHQGGVARVL